MVAIVCDLVTGRRYDETFARVALAMAMVGPSGNRKSVCSTVTFISGHTDSTAILSMGETVGHGYRARTRVCVSQCVFLYTCTLRHTSSYCILHICLNTEITHGIAMMRAGAGKMYSHPAEAAALVPAAEHEISDIQSKGLHRLVSFIIGNCCSCL